MKPRVELIDPKIILDVLDYNPETGIFRWRVTAPPRGIAGNIAGCAGGRYWVISVFGKSYYAHRLAWAMFHGEWPEDQIDHINCDKFDNRITNLRQATTSQNGENKKTAQKNNKSGLLGVSRSGKKNPWTAQIVSKGKKYFLGNYKTSILAHEAYLTAKRNLHQHGTI